MADEFENDPTESDESSVHDPRGEDLASDRLPDAEPYTLSADEDEAEELTDAPTSGRRHEDSFELAADEGEDQYVDDPEQLAAAEAEADAATNSTPVPSKRPRKKGAAAEPVVAADPEEGAAVATASPLRPKKRTAEVEKKDHATPKQRKRAQTAEHHRTGPVQFVKESVGELRKVVWPTGSQVSQYFVVVLIFVLFIIAFVMGLDFLFGWLLLKLFG